MRDSQTLTFVASPTGHEMNKRLGEFAPDIDPPPVTNKLLHASIKWSLSATSYAQQSKTYQSIPWRRIHRLGRRPTCNTPLLTKRWWRVQITVLHTFLSVKNPLIESSFPWKIMSGRSVPWCDSWSRGLARPSWAVCSSSQNDRPMLDLARLLHWSLEPENHSISKLSSLFTRAVETFMHSSHRTNLCV